MADLDEARKRAETAEELAEVLSMRQLTADEAAVAVDTILDASASVLALAARVEDLEGAVIRTTNEWEATRAERDAAIRDRDEWKAIALSRSVLASQPDGGGS